MSTKALVLILASVCLSVLAQIMLKVGMGTDTARQAMSNPSLWRGYVTVVFAPAVLVGLAAYGVSALVWMRVLADVDVSKAYPFVALGMVLTMAAGALFLGEVIPPIRMIGAGFVVVGIILVGMS